MAHHSRRPDQLNHAVLILPFHRVVPFCNKEEDEYRISPRIRGFAVRARARARDTTLSKTIETLSLRVSAGVTRCCSTTCVETKHQEIRPAAGGGSGDARSSSTVSKDGIGRKAGARNRVKLVARHPLRRRTRIPFSRIPRAPAGPINRARNVVDVIGPRALLSLSRLRTLPLFYLF